MGRSKFVFHGLDCFPELHCIRATGGEFLLKEGDLGIPDRLCGFILALPEGKPVDRKLRGMGFPPKVVLSWMSSAKSRENQGL